jgi:hypothetical protein
MVFSVPLKGKTNRIERGVEQMNHLLEFIETHAGLKAGFQRGDFDLYVEGINFCNGEVPKNEGNTVIKVTMENQKCFAPVIEWILCSLGGTVRKESAILFERWKW